MQTILNLGCGTNKIKGCVNVDKLEGSDVVLDILDLKTKFEDESADKIYLFHVIEHIPEYKHHSLISQIWNVLKPEGKLVIAYPEFVKCAKNYIENYKGARDFWKATIFGRQLHPGDFHVSLMDTTFFKDFLEQEGFKIFWIGSELGEDYNTVIKCEKAKRPITKEELYKKVLF